MVQEKSTLANILSGKNGYEISGSLKYEGENLQNIPIEERAQKENISCFPISFRNTWCKYK